MAATIKEMAKVNVTDATESEKALQEVEENLANLRKLADEIESRDRPAAQRIEEIQRQLEKSLAQLRKFTRPDVDELPQEALDRLAAKEISSRVSRGRSTTPLTVDDVFGEYEIPSTND